MSAAATNGETSQGTPQESPDQTEQEQPPVIARKKIAIRLLYAILFLIILSIVVAIVELVVVFQFIFFFSTRKPNESVRQFSNKISVYGYRIFRYVTLCENRPPFPFREFPAELDPTEEQVIAD